MAELEYDFDDMQADIPLDELLRRAEEEIAMEMMQDQAPEPDRPAAPVAELAKGEELGAVEALLGGSASNAKDQPKEKKKRIVPKLTEEMMMGPRGLTNLIQRAKKFKKRSTHEKTLNAFMEMIQLWGHELFPKENFKDFIRTSQKLCTKRGMRVYRESEIREARRQKNGYYENIVTKSSYKKNISLESFRNMVDTEKNPSAITSSAPIERDAEREDSAVEESVVEESASVEQELNLTSNTPLLSNDKLAIIELNRQKALAKLAERQRQREEERTAKEREEEVTKMLGESRHLFSL